MLVNTPHAAELNAERVMRSWGYLDAQATTGGADGGIDVRSSKALAQVKFRGSKAGSPEIQNLVGAREADHTKALMFFDFKGYSPQSVRYADRMAVGLYVYDTNGNVKAVNAIGRYLMATTFWTRVGAALHDPTYQVGALLLIGTLLAVVLLAMSTTSPR